jgi:hypothetical protein
VKLGAVDFHTMPFTIHKFRENRCSENHTWSRKLNLARILYVIASDSGPPRAGSMDGGVPDCSLLSMFRNGPGCHVNILSRKKIQMKETFYRG